MNYSRMASSCANGDDEWVKKSLDKAKELGEDVDIFYSDYTFFRCIFARNYHKVLKLLLDYYEEKYLQGDEHSQEYIFRKKLLQEGIQEAWDAYDPSPEIEALIKKYMPAEKDTDETDSTADLDDLPDPTGDYEDVKEDLSFGREAWDTPALGILVPSAEDLE